MQKKVSKPLAVALSVLLTSSVLAACQSNSGKSASGSTEPSANVENSSQHEQVTLVFWNRIDKTLFDNAIKGFEAKYPYIHIDLQNLPAGTASQAQYQAALSKSELPDIFGSAFTLNQLVGLNQVHSLNEVFPADVQKEYPQGVFSDGNTMVGDQIYQFPLYTAYHGTELMFYNKDILNKYSITSIPKTWDELLLVGKTIYQKSGGKTYGLVFGAKSGVVPFGQLASSIDPDVTVPGGMNLKTGRYEFANNGYLQTAAYLKQLLDEKVLDPASLESSPADARSYLAAGKDAFIFDGNWTGGTLQDDFKFSNWDVAPMPTLDGKPQYRSFTGGASEVLYVSKYTKHWDEAKLFMEYLRDHVYSDVIAKGRTGPAIKLDQIKDATAPFPQYDTIIKDMDQLNILTPNIYTRNSAMDSVMQSFLSHAPNETPEMVAQGYLAGQIKDVKAEFEKLTQAYNDQLDQAIQSSNGKVTANDFKFPNWTPFKPYTSQDYQALK